MMPKSKSKSKQSRRKNNAGVATCSKKIEKMKIRKCVVRVKRIKSSTANALQPISGTGKAMAGNIMLKKCVIKLTKFKQPQSRLENKAALSSTSTVPQTKIPEAMELPCSTASLFLSNDSTESSTPNESENSQAILTDQPNDPVQVELPGIFAAPLSNDSVVVQLGTTPQKGNLEPICPEDSYKLTTSSEPLNEREGGKGRADKGKKVTFDGDF